VVAIKPSINNKLLTVLNLFLEAVKEYSCPSQVCGDQDGENIDLSIWIIMYCGANYALFMWGS
jgi:hypothetical protein